MKKNRVKPENKTTMKCTDAIRMISDFPERGKAGDMPAELSRHLETCGACRHFMQNYAAGMAQLRSGQRTAADPEFFDRLVVRMNSESSTSVAPAGMLARIVRFSPGVVAAAASVVLGIWLGGRLFSYSRGLVENNAYPLMQRSGLLESYAGDLQLEDENTLLIESYLFDNENTNGNDTE